MKSLVTGGLGFVGSNLVDMLVEMGDEVVVIDNLSSTSAKMEYQNPGAEYYIQDIERIHGTLIGHKFDRIFHLAAKARIQPSFDDPAGYFWSNAMGTMEVLDFARISRSGTVIYATTSSKNHGSHLITPYTFSKVIGEDACRMYSEIYGMRTASATFYNVYGPREPREGEWATVVAKFSRQSQKGEMVTVVGDGMQSRDFTHVEDICKGLIRMSELDLMGDNINLGRGMPITILDVAKAWTDNEDQIIFTPLRKNEGLHTLCDVDKTLKTIGWSATHNLTDYIESEKRKYAKKIFKARTA
jgi:UDP-glucose 4-epimerase